GLLVVSERGAGPGRGVLVAARPVEAATGFLRGPAGAPHDALRRVSSDRLVEVADGFRQNGKRVLAAARHRERRPQEAGFAALRPGIDPGGIEADRGVEILQRR